MRVRLVAVPEARRCRVSPRSAVHPRDGGGLQATLGAASRASPDALLLRAVPDPSRRRSRRPPFRACSRGMLDDLGQRTSPVQICFESGKCVATFGTRIPVAGKHGATSAQPETASRIREQSKMLYHQQLKKKMRRARVRDALDVSSRARPLAARSRHGYRSGLGSRELCVAQLSTWRLRYRSSVEQHHP